MDIPEYYKQFQNQPPKKEEEAKKPEPKNRLRRNRNKKGNSDAFTNSSSKQLNGTLSGQLFAFSLLE